jgi:hypothetical protein
MASAEAIAEWTPLHELVALTSAENVEEFYRRLILMPSAGGNPADAFGPECLLHHYHQDSRYGVGTTVMLLVTDRRWRNATGRLIQRIASSGLVPEEELDLLAEVFLAADRQLYWEAPAAWFDGGVDIEIHLDLGPPDDDGSESGDHDDDDESSQADDRPVLVARDVRPPLRRWAAGRAVRAEPAAWGAIMERGRELDARTAAAVVLGLLDALDVLPPPAQAFLRNEAARWPQRNVRQAAAAIDACVAKPAAAAGSEAAPPPPPLKASSQQPALF